MHALVRCAHSPAPKAGDISNIYFTRRKNISKNARIFVFPT